MNGWNDLSNLRVKLLLRNLEYLPGKLPKIILGPIYRPIFKGNLPVSKQDTDQ